MPRTPNPPDHKPRLSPPATLTDDERKTWRALVRSVSSTHFTAADAPLLVEYCRAIAMADKAAEELREGTVIGGKVSPWVTVQEKAVRSIVALSARLRMAPQSRFDRLKAGTNTRAGLDDDDGPFAQYASPRKPLTGLASFRK